jgi:hypothetical protein
MKYYIIVIIEFVTIRIFPEYKRKATEMQKTSKVAEERNKPETKKLKHFLPILQNLYYQPRKTHPR